MKSEKIAQKLLRKKNVASVRYDENEIFIITNTTKETQAEKVLDELIHILELYNNEKDNFHFGIKKMCEIYPNDDINEELGLHYVVYANLIEVQDASNQS